MNTPPVGCFGPGRYGDPKHRAKLVELLNQYTHEHDLQKKLQQPPSKDFGTTILGVAEEEAAIDALNEAAPDGYLWEYAWGDLYFQTIDWWATDA